jgi:hypothetical protein
MESNSVENLRYLEKHKSRFQAETEERSENYVELVFFWKEESHVVASVRCEPQVGNYGR